MKLKDISAQEFRFRTIVELKESGHSQQAISSLVGCSQAWVSKVLKRYTLKGEKGLKVKGKAPGATPKMKEEQLEQLKTMLSKGALAYEFATDNWTRERIAKLILDQFAVQYHPAHISRIMNKLGFSLQKPKSRSYKKDAQAIKQWKNKDLPAIKKSKN